MSGGDTGTAASESSGAPAASAAAGAAGVFPSRAIVQGHAGGRLPPESALVAGELRARGVPVTVLTSEEFLGPRAPAITRGDLIVGDFSWTRAALARLGVPMPPAADYPDCLAHLLHRRIWRSTLGELAAALRADPAARVFFKPAEDIKAFSGEVASPEWLVYLLSEHPPALPILCSELVTMVAEYRAYVVHAAVRSVVRYKGPESPPIDEGVVREAVRTLAASAEGRALAGCGIDFAVFARHDGGGHVTGLVEVNDGFSLGAYEGVPARDYTDMLASRWAQLVA